MKFGRRAIVIATVVAFLLLLVGGRAVAGFIAELLWYRSTGFESVFWTHWRIGLLVRGTIAVAVASAVYLNLWLVARSLGAIRVRRRYGNIEIAERLPRGYLMLAVAVVSILSAWWLSGGVMDPVATLAAIEPVAWGLRDPLFGFDAAFYVFQLPVLNRLQTLGALIVFWILLLAVAAYAATGAIKVTDGRPSLTPTARRHLGVLAAAFLVLFAINVWLDRYGMMIDGSGFGGGIGYTDVNARLPAKVVIFFLALGAAGAVGYGSWVGKLYAPMGAVLLLVVGLVGAEGIYAPSVQRFLVEPNQFPREEAYIQYHLDFTRRAYRLDGISRESLPYIASAEPAESVLVDRIRTVPLWDPRPLLTTYRQRQGLFRYYTFSSVHHDRYARDGDIEPIAISVRELETSELEDAAQTWQNLHLNYVAGDGAVVSPVARMAADGTPIFYVWDRDPPKLSADAPVELRLEDPSIYFGERSQEYVILGPEHKPAGIPLDAAWKKLLFAWAFQSKNILLSGDLARDSKILYRRQIVERVQATAPFLRLSADRSAFPVIHDGRIVWIVDAFTTSATFPLAPVLEFEGQGIRYIRNAVKATVDAVTGDVELYVADAEDPILATYMRIFPELIRPLEEMPADLRDHLRYPVQLMDLQAQVLSAYHLLDPRAFYEQQDVWSIATEQYRGSPMTMEPRYALYPLPGANESEFVLSLPFVARGRQNMTALMMTRNDPANYGEQILYLLPRDVTVPGPQQIEAAIDQDPEISQQLALWRRGGSDVARGHLIVVPVAGTLVFVEPLFLEAENAAIPQLERVILALGGRVVMESSFEAAVAALLSGATPSSRDPEENPVEEGATRADERMNAARELLEQAEAELRAGDWEGFGRSWNALRDALMNPSTVPQ